MREYGLGCSSRRENICFLDPMNTCMYYIKWSLVKNRNNLKTINIGLPVLSLCALINRHPNKQ